MAPKTLRRIRYTVRGKGTFPFDMLRYDNSFPATNEDKFWIGGYGDEPEHAMEYAHHPKQFDCIPGPLRHDERELMLESYFGGDNAASSELLRVFPTRGRWASFLWSVTEVYPIEKVPFEEVPKNRRR